MCTHTKLHTCVVSGGGTDYGPLPAACNPLTFSAGSGSQLCCNIPINDDNLVEDPESFNVGLTTTDSNNANLVASTTAIVNIADNDRKRWPWYRRLKSCRARLNSFQLLLIDK